MKRDRDRLVIAYWAIARLKPYPKNSRDHSPEQVADIVTSIKANGFNKPIIVDDRGEILAGHGAYMAAQQLDMREVPVIQRMGLTQAQKRAYRLADNKVAEGSTWNTPFLQKELGDLKAMGVDLSSTGFDPREVEMLLRPPPSDTEPAVPIDTGPTITKPGDLWLLGEHRLMCGDSTKGDTLRTLMAGAKAACVYTDPPYGVSYEARSGKFEMIKGDELRRGQLAKMLHGAFQAANEHVAATAGWYIWHASSTREEFSRAMRDIGLVELATLIWVKPGMVLGWSDYRWAHEPCFYAARQGTKPDFYGDRTDTTIWRAAARTAAGKSHTEIGTGVILTAKDGSEVYVAGAPPKGRKVRHVHLERDEPALLQAGHQHDDVWEVSRDNGHGKEGAWHPNQKPVELARRAIINSTREGEIVLDLFNGSGSMIIGAQQTKRIGYAIDLEPHYVDQAVRRWQKHTGKAATHAKEKKTFEAIAKARTGKKAR